MFKKYVLAKYKIVSSLNKIEQWISEEFDNYETADRAADFYGLDGDEDAAKHFRAQKESFKEKFRKAKIEQDCLVVYRCTKKENPQDYIEELKKGEEAGAYWAYTEKGAQCVFGKGKPGQEILLKALLEDYDQINAAETAIRSADPKYAHEDEIVFEKDTDLKLVEIRDKKTKAILWQEEPIDIKLKPAFYLS
jgi:hypothetical protein